MQISNYEPDWDNKKVINRATIILEWCNFTLNGKPTPVSFKVLDGIFGSGGKDMSDYFRANLLIRSGNYIVGIKPYDYSLRKEGYDKIKEKVAPNIMFSTAPKQLKDKYESQILTGEFDYSLKSDRYYHGLQNIKRDKKQAFWENYGYKFDYDIEACAPTILLQLAEKYGLHKLVGESIQNYLQNKDSMREHVANLTGCDLYTSKRVINSLFNGARLSTSPFCTFTRSISKDGIIAMQQDKQVRLLILSIKHMWQRIARYEGNLSKSKDKWAIYFRYERQILEVVKDYLDKNQVKYFTEHDGWRCNKEINLIKLEEEIKKRVGIKIQIKQQHTYDQYCPSKMVNQGNNICSVLEEMI